MIDKEKYDFIDHVVHLTLFEEDRLLNEHGGDYDGLEEDGIDSNEYYRIITERVINTLKKNNNYIQEESVSDRFAFKAIPRLLEMIEPTDRAKAYITKLADALEAEGYLTDAKIVRESLKIMNGEKVSMATMDEEPLSDDLEEAAFQHLSKYYGTNIIWDEDERCVVRDFKAGAEWQKAKDQETIELAEDHAMLAGMEKMREQMIANAMDCEVSWYDGPCLDYTREKEDNALAKINASVGDKVKVIILKDE